MERIATIVHNEKDFIFQFKNMKTIKLIVVGPATEKAKQDLIVSEILEGMSEWKNQILHFGRASGRTHLAKKIEEELQQRSNQNEEKRYLVTLRKREELQEALNELLEDVEEGDLMGSVFIDILQSQIEEFDEEIAEYEASKQATPSLNKSSFSITIPNLDLDPKIVNWWTQEISKQNKTDKTTADYNDCFTRRFTAPYKHDMSDGGKLKRAGDYIDLITNKSYTEEQILNLHNRVTDVLRRLGIKMCDINDVMLNDILNGFANGE